jgi:hypothetical protein
MDGANGFSVYSPHLADAHGIERAGHRHALGGLERDVLILIEVHLRVIVASHGE